MRYSIFDFNQEKCAELNLTMNDLLLLDYIQKASASPRMKHHQTEPLCVWLNHEKIMEDLPILNVSESTLKRWLKNLVDLGLLKREITVSKNYGRRAYYGITDKLVDLQISRLMNEPLEELQKLTDEPLENKPGLMNEPSYKGLVYKDNRLKTNNNKIISTKSSSKKLVKKKSLYESCMDLINIYTKDKPELFDLLVQYLNMRLEIKDRPLYKNQWKGILNKLDKIHEEEGTSYEEIIQFSIDRGYASFFPVPKYSGNKKKKAYDSGVSCEKYTEEEMKEIRKWQKEMIAKGEKMVF